MKGHPARATSCFLAFLLIWVSGVFAQVPEKIEPLSNLLNPDGTINLQTGFTGALDVSGYYMTTGSNGEPRFVPREQRLASTVDDNLGLQSEMIPFSSSTDANWSSGFSYPGADVIIRALAVVGTDLYAGGEFTVIGGVNAKRIAMWNGTTWSALGTGMNGTVRALAVVGSNLYIGGDFSSADGVSAVGVVRWNGSSFTPIGTGISGGVNALAAMGSVLYVAGNLVTAGGVSVNRIALWDGTLWSALGDGLDNVTNALAVIGTDLYAGGQFTNAGAVVASYIAKWDGTSWSAVGTGMNGRVDVLTVSGTDLYAGGSFTTAGAISANRIAKWNGTTWSALGSGLNNGVLSITVVGSDLYAGGLFTTAGGLTANYAAKWNGSTFAAVLPTGSFNGIYSISNSIVYALAVIGSDLYAGGQFSNAGSVVASHIAKWNGTSWSALGSGTSGPVQALAVIGTDLYAGGTFIMAGGGSANYIAKWDGSAWSPLGSGISNSVVALASIGSNLYAGGSFLTAGGITVNSIAKWDGTSWSTLGSGVNGGVNALAVIGTDLYVGGGFSMAGGMSANAIAKWDGSSWSTLGSGLNTTVHSLAVSGTNLYVGGDFTTAGGSGVNYIARWNGTSWSAVGSGTSGSVYGLITVGADVYAVGNFLTAGAVSANYIAKWDGSIWSALGSGIGSGSGLKALATTGGSVYVGGGFALAGNKSSISIARWTLDLGSVSLSQSVVSVSSGTLTSGSTVTVTLQAKDASGVNLTSGGLPVAFALSGGGTSSGTFSSVTDNGNGTYTATFTGITAGTAKTISATIGGSPVTSTLPTITVTTGPASILAAVSGNAQSTTIKSALPSPMVVKVTDAGGNPIQGASVIFALGIIPTGATGHALSVTTTTTNASGQASTALTLGDKLGSYTVTATSTGLNGSPLTLTATAVVGAASKIVLTSGNNQRATVGTTLPTPFIVTVTDADGQAVSGRSVIFAIASAPALTGHSLSVSNTTTDANGKAQSVLTLGTSAGQYVVTATATGLTGSPVNFSVTATGGVGVSMSRISGNNQSAIVRTPLPNILIVQVFDVSGNPSEGSGVAFAFTSVPSGAMGQAIGTPSTASADDGFAWTSVTLGNRPGSYVISATLSGGTLSPIFFNATATVGPASAIVLASGNEQSGVVLASLPNPFVVTATDQSGNPAAGAPIIFAITSLPSGATGQSLSVTSTSTNAAGQASTILKFGNKVGTYSVTATSIGLTGSPVSFTASASAGAASVLTVASGNNQSGTVSTSLANPFVVMVTDAGGNPVSGTTVAFAISSVPQGALGQILGAGSATTASDGTVSTTLKLGDKAGVYVVTATATGLIGSPALFTATAVAVSSAEWIDSVPVSFHLHQNYPNPFNPTTSIRFGLPREEYVTLSVYDPLGKKVAAIEEIRSAGLHHVTFSANEIPSGMYFYRLQAGSFVETKKLLLLK